MNPLLEDFCILLVRELRSMSREIELFPDDASIWETPIGIANSAGVLAQHTCGNLQHFIGAILGKTGYVRDRDAEFSDRRATRAELLREIEETIDVVRDVIPGLSAATLAETYPQPVGHMTVNTRRFILHLCSHLAFHVGQVGYLRRMLTGESASSGALSIKPIANSQPR